MGFFSNGTESDITETAESQAPEATIRFELTELVHDRIRVKGTDKFGATGEEVLYVRQLNEINELVEHEMVHDAFDAKVTEFFAPLTEAAAALKADHKPKVDPTAVIVLDEGQAGVEARDEVIVHLDRDSHIVRLIQTGNDDRLIWVDGRLEILAA